MSKARTSTSDHDHRLPIDSEAHLHIAERLRRGLEAVEAMATRTSDLTDRIRRGVSAYERRLCALEGKVRASVVLDAKEGSMLSFEPMNNDWRLLWSLRSQGGQLRDQRPVVGADIEVQIQAIAKLPDLLDAMVHAHDEHLKAIEPAAHMMEQIGIDAVGLYADEAA